MQISRFSILHADTPYRLFKRDWDYGSDKLMLGGQALSGFPNSRILYAIWSSSSKTDLECKRDFFPILNRFKQELFNWYSNSNRPMPEISLSVEDLRLIGNDISFLNTLRDAGVRSVIPFWGGVTALGGSFDTEEGLSPFGRKVIERCFDLGLLVDISHASDRSAHDILEMARYFRVPVIASHSGFRSICDHKRNLTDQLAESVAEVGGLIGITFCRPHLANSEKVGLAEVVQHISYGLSHFGNCLAIGTDYDGIGETPDGLRDPHSFPSLAEFMLSSGITESQTEGFFFANADRFFDCNPLFKPDNPILQI